MKSLLFTFLMVLSCYMGYSQNEKTKKSNEKLLKEVSENACKCVDSIDVSNKSKDEIAKEIGGCINKQVGAYQIGIKLMNVEELAKNAKEKDGKKEVNISVDLNENSKEYKEYYFEIERNMMENCASIKQKIATNDKKSDKSISKNAEALKWYSKATEEHNKDNIKKAVSYYEKAVQADSIFAFAWDNIGLCYRKLGDYDKSLYAYKKSLEIDSLGEMPLQNIAVVYIYRKEYENAIKSYERLLRINKNNPETYYGIGQVYYEYLQEYEKSLDNICKAYNIYVAQKSPYRTDAEKIIRYIYAEMKKSGKENRFYEILKANNITAN